MTFDVRIHGRGGQGVVTAAELLSLAAFDEGLHAQALPSFGSERTGAPVVAFCRIDERPIRSHDPVDHPNLVVLQDPTLLRAGDVLDGLADDGVVVVNSSRTPAELAAAGLHLRPGQRVVTVPALPPEPVRPGTARPSRFLHLVRKGHSVTVRESAPAAGGMMRYGIPAYRLPREILDGEVARVVALGVDLELNTPVTDLDAAVAEGWDAVFLAVGAQLGHRTYLPAASAAKVVDAVSMLHGLEEGERPLLGRRVAVYGGGNTAVDAARTAKRLGASDAVVVYRRTRERMPANAEEVIQAEEEGVEFHWLSTIDRVEPDGLLIEQMELGEDGFPQPTGRTERLAADSVVLALGQDTDLSLLGSDSACHVSDGVVETDWVLATGLPGVFAGGDVVAGERSVTTAIGHGRRVAASIDDWLAGRTPSPEAEPNLAQYEALNTWYFEDASRSHRPRLELARRSSTFDEVVHGLDADTALFEARRCLSCGSCFSCDNCYALCPDNAVLKIGPPGEYVIDLDYCKGCGICVEECPAGAIEMVPEDI